MPTVYRTMWEVDGKPLVGETANCLGVRTPPDEHPDIRPEQGMVNRGMGGLSVAPHWSKLPLFLIPKHLEHIVARARAKPGMRCFKWGDGGFEDSELTRNLYLRVENMKHGLIEPANPMSIEEFQACLAGTRDSWTIDESHE